MARLDTQNRSPKVEILADLRRRVTRVWDVLNQVPKTPAALDADIALPWATPDETYSECLLVHQDVTGQGQGEGSYYEPNKNPPQLIRVFEQIDPVLETFVWEPDVTIGQDGLKTVVLHYLQFSAGTAVYQTPGVDVCPAPHADCVLKTEERTDNGTVRDIKRTYVSSGLIASTETLKNDGALSILSATYVNEVPPTPAGYTLIDADVQYPNGLPVYKYTFAKGTGLISTTTEYEISPDEGATGVTRTSYIYLTTPSVNVNPTTPPVGAVTLSVDYKDQDGYRIWTVMYASGQGTVASDLSIENFGNLIIYSKTSINTPPADPSPMIGGTVELIKQSQRNGTRIENGNIIYEYEWAEGYGVIDKRIQQRDGGLRLETWVSLGIVYDASFMLPAGILLLKDEENMRGTKRFTVTCMQNATGGDPTVGTALSFSDKHPFRYPGRAKAYKKSFIAIAPDATSFTANAYDVFLSPPVDLEVDATIEVDYSLDSTLSLGTGFWNPDNWATVAAAWETYDIRPISVIQTHTGYRAINDGVPLNFTAGEQISSGGTVNLTGVNTSCMGQRVYGTSSGSIVVTGGPPAPDNRVWVLAAKVELAFTALDGTKYYRKTLVSALIPAQTALPV